MQQLAAETIRRMPRLASPALLLAGYAYTFHILDSYDWGHAFTRLLCFAALFAITLLLYTSKENKPSLHINWLEIILLIVVITPLVIDNVHEFTPWLSQRSRVDIGYATEDATIMLFRDRENPYQSKTIATFGHAEEKFHGYKYGPLMPVAYVLNVFIPSTGLKISNVVYLMLTGIATAILIFNKRNHPLQNIAGILFAITLLVLPQRLWHELFVQGANDLFPMLLMLIAVILTSKRLFFFAGVAAGLACSAKIFPAVLLVIILGVRWPINWRLVSGIMIGLLPFIPFLIWDAQAFINNVFIFHAIKNANSTSLYSITPTELHYLFPLAQIVAIIYVIKRNLLKEKLGTQHIVVQLTLLYIVTEVAYKELHQNHLIYLIPLLALTLTWYRHRLIRLPYLW